eukprot:TRINITY_DN1320_c0_g1_i1.p1 TRINITY_DN1320_c0_g1~~TRINITY_DN1320_c0_g1_i1.p1  ORF type:complete len:641 (-),score=46.36 TRINITY_DN1320_c0_g1_i1:64-1773(-)
MAVMFIPLVSGAKAKTFEQCNQSFTALGEGFVPCCYIDSKGYKTVGIGMLLDVCKAGFNAKTITTPEQCTAAEKNLQKILEEVMPGRAADFLDRALAPDSTICSRKGSLEEHRAFCETKVDKRYLLEEEPAMKLFNKVYAKSESAVQKMFKELKGKAPTAYYAVVDMFYNMGSLRKFTDMRKALEHNLFIEAAKQAIVGKDNNSTSKWCTDVKETRCNRAYQCILAAGCAEAVVPGYLGTFDFTAGTVCPARQGWSAQCCQIWLEPDRKGTSSVTCCPKDYTCVPDSCRRGSVTASASVEVLRDAGRWPNPLSKDLTFYQQRGGLFSSVSKKGIQQWKTDPQLQLRFVVLDIRGDLPWQSDKLATETMVNSIAASSGLQCAKCGPGTGSDCPTKTPSLLQVLFSPCYSCNTAATTQISDAVTGFNAIGMLWLNFAVEEAYQGTCTQRKEFYDAAQALLPFRVGIRAEEDEAAYDRLACFLPESGDWDFVWWDATITPQYIPMKGEKQQYKIDPTNFTPLCERCKSRPEMREYAFHRDRAQNTLSVRKGGMEARRTLVWVTAPTKCVETK